MCNSLFTACSSNNGDWLGRLGHGSPHSVIELDAQINIPYGMLLGERGCIVQQSETADFLFGISRKCDYIVLSAENQEAQKLYSCDSYSIELRFRSIRGPKKLSETVFRNKAIVAICFSSAVALDEALFKLQKVQSFVSFCCGWYAGVELALSHHGDAGAQRPRAGGGRL